PGLLLGRPPDRRARPGRHGGTAPDRLGAARPGGRHRGYRRVQRAAGAVPAAAARRRDRRVRPGGRGHGGPPAARGAAGGRRTVGGYAGTKVEALRDSPLADAWFAQPSGLSARGDRLWIADSESSALRFVADGAVYTAVGQGLFDFGLVDGPATQALFQHPL